MLTRCPTCQTTFRVTAEQLRYRQGRVRCGKCHSVFDGLQSLLDETAAATPPAQEPVAAPTPAPPPALPETQPAPAFAAQAPVALAPATQPPEAPISTVPTSEVPVSELAPPVSTLADEEVGLPEIEYVELDDPEFEDEFDEEATSDDDGQDEDFEPVEDVNPYTKTVVGFGRYFAEVPASQDNGIPDITIDIEVPAPVDAHTETGIGFDQAEPAPAQPKKDDFADTVVMSLRPPDDGDLAGIEIPEVKFDLGIIDIGIADVHAESKQAATPPIAIDGTGEAATVPSAAIEVAEIAEAAADTAAESGRPAAPGPAAPPPEGDDFTKTVVISMRPPDGIDFGATRFPEAPSGFDAIDIGNVRSGQTVAESAATEIGADEIATIPYEPATGATPPKRPPTRAFGIAADIDVGAGGNTEVDTIVLPPRGTPAPEPEHAKLDIDLESIGDLSVAEEEEETSSVTDLRGPTISFPHIESTDDDADLPSHERANALLRELVPTAVPLIKTVHLPATGPETLPPVDETGASGIDLPLPDATTEPPVEAQAPRPAVPPDDLVDEPLPAQAEAEPVPELQEIPAHRRWPWIAGAALAACTLLAQAVVHYRIELSVMFPGTKPALVAMCEVLECKVALPSRIELIGIDSSDLSPSADTPGNLQLSASLRNRAPFNQAWPHLELTLTDSTDKPLVRRALGPTDYLPSIRKIEEGFPARSEQPVYLSLQAPGVPAAGYRLYVFYP